jgi:vacuolar-type H+-ATPase subunit E/Vma4
LRAIRAAVDARSGGGVHVDVEFVCDSIDAGCVASTPDGRIVYDNTYQRRLERQRRSLRRAIQREIEQSHE